MDRQYYLAVLTPNSVFLRLLTAVVESGSLERKQPVEYLGIQVCANYFYAKIIFITITVQDFLFILSDVVKKNRHTRLNYYYVTARLDWLL